MWILEDKLAISPLPRRSDIPELARVFDAVVVLVEPHELMGLVDQYLSAWHSYGVETLYAPIPDFHPAELLELHRINMWINEKLEKGYRVLVHCHGGIGRSGMVAIAYLIYRGMDFYKAVTSVREKRPGAAENEAQLRILEDYHELYTVLANSLDIHVKKLYDMGKREYLHASKSLQVVIELVSDSGISIDKPVLYKSLLYHCLRENELEELARSGIIDEDVIELIKRAGEEKYADIEPLLLAIGHTSDYYYDQRVVFTNSERIGDTTYTVFYCKYGCKEVIDKLKPLFNKLGEFLERVFELSEQPYTY
ncbi:MAG: dual specificity protein phosphatase family protein [Thermoprotei archaeon]